MIAMDALKLTVIPVGDGQTTLKETCTSAKGNRPGPRETTVGNQV